MNPAVFGRALVKNPGASLLARKLRLVSELIGTDAAYDNRNALEILSAEPGGVPASRILPRRHARARRAARRRTPVRRSCSDGGVACCGLNANRRFRSLRRWSPRSLPLRAIAVHGSTCPPLQPIPAAERRPRRRLRPRKHPRRPPPSRATRRSPNLRDPSRSRGSTRRSRCSKRRRAPSTCASFGTGTHTPRPTTSREPCGGGSKRASVPVAPASSAWARAPTGTTACG